MRFQTIGRVAGEDAERVLVVLEQRLRAMVSDVERDGNRLILSGLGPSSRAINRHDTTVIDVWAEDGVTAIGADVSFQASAFLGDSGQEEIMRFKLQRLFEETEEQLDFERRRAEARISRMQIVASTGATAGVYERELENLAVASPDATTHEHYSEELVDDATMPAHAVVQLEEPIAPSTGTLAEVEEVEEVAGLEAKPARAFVDVDTQSAEAEIVVEEVQETVVDSRLDVAAPGAQQIAVTPAEAAVIAEAPPEAAADEEIETVKAAVAPCEADDMMEEEVVEEGDSKSSRWIVWGVLAACIPAFLPFGVHYFSSLRTASEANRAAPAVSAPKVVASVPARPVSAADPAELLRQWEMAMRSSDAAAQAAFYAVPVERYLTRHNVSKEAVQADKQAAIDNRKGLWTVKMERVKINHQSDTLVIVSLRKHYIEQENGKTVREWFVPSQLKLKNEYGIWWITSESDLGWALSPDDL